MHPTFSVFLITRIFIFTGLLHMLWKPMLWFRKSTDMQKHLKHCYICSCGIVLPIKCSKSHVCCTISRHFLVDILWMYGKISPSKRLSQPSWQNQHYSTLMFSYIGYLLSYLSKRIQNCPSRKKEKIQLFTVHIL